MKNTKIILTVFIILLIVCVRLYSEEHAQGEIHIRFHNYITNEQIREFIMDYEHYELILVKDYVVRERTKVFLFYFNFELIDCYDFWDLILEDERVDAARLNYEYYWAQVLVYIRLKNGTNSEVFFNDYKEPYKLEPALYGWDEWYADGDFGMSCFFLHEFHSSAAMGFYSSLEMIDVLREDDRVVVAVNPTRMTPGQILISLYQKYNQEILDSIISDYSEYNLQSERPLHHISTDLHVFNFNFSMISEIELVEILKTDERFNNVGINGYYDVPLSVKDNTLPRPRLNSNSYPNPVNGDMVNFNIERGDSKIENPNLEISIYNVRGQLINRSSDFQTKESQINFTWDLKNTHGNVVSNGIYFYRIISNDDVSTGRFIILKNNN